MKWEVVWRITNNQSVVANQQPPGHILPIIQGTQGTSSFPVPGWGISSHTPGKAQGYWGRQQLGTNCCYWKSATDYIVVSQQKASEKGWLSCGSMKCQWGETHCYRRENIRADWHLTFATKMVNLTTCKQHPSFCPWAHRQQLQQCTEGP